MTNQEAINYIKNYLNEVVYVPKCVEAHTRAIEALEKQIPKKPSIVKSVYGSDADGNRGIELTDVVCPCCGRDVMLNTDYCQDCGQAISYEEVEK